MPQAVEVAFYQLGMRFTHCEWLHGECTTLISGRGGAHRVVLLRYCLCALGRAMDDITRIANLDEALAEMGQALIREFEQLWNTWTSLSTEQLQSDEMNDEPFNENASRFDDFMSNQVLPRVRSPSLDCDKWYELGREVSRVYWSNPNWGQNRAPGAQPRLRTHLHQVGRRGGLAGAGDRGTVGHQQGQHPLAMPWHCGADQGKKGR